MFTRRVGFMKLSTCNNGILGIFMLDVFITMVYELFDENFIQAFWFLVYVAAWHKDKNV